MTNPFPYPKYIVEAPPFPIEEIPIKIEGGVSYLGYGPGGSGKSYFLGSIGADGVIACLHRKDMTFRSPNFRKKYPNPPKIVYIEEKDYDEKTGIFKSAKAFDALCDFTDWFIDKQDEFKTLGIDDGTAFSQFARNKGMESKSQVTNENAVNSLEQSKHFGYLRADIGDYNEEMKIIIWYLSNNIPRIKRAGKNFVMVAHERHIYEKASRIGGTDTLIKILPGFTGKTFPDAVQLHFDFVWNHEVVNGNKFRAKTVGNEKIIAKTSWETSISAKDPSVFTEVVDNPNFQDILKKIRGN
jgi:hypothetical protein